MHRRIALLALIGIGVAWPAAGHDVISTKLTWTREISRLFLKRCMSCHQNGGKAFPLTTWEEARPWAVAIREEVTNRTMPPWGAVKGFGEFLHDAALTQEEIQTIADWVNGGAPEGEKIYATEELPKSWNPPAAKGTRVRFAQEYRLRNRGALAGLRPVKATKDETAQVLLLRPDGTAEPLLWLRAWRPEFAHDFVFARPVEAPAGSRVVVMGESAGPWELVLAPAATASQAQAR